MISYNTDFGNNSTFIPPSRIKFIIFSRANVEQSLRKFDGGGKHPCDTSHRHGSHAGVERLCVQQRRWTVDGHELVRKRGHRHNESYIRT